MGRAGWWLAAGLGCAAAWAGCAAAGETKSGGSGETCTVGSEGCPCTKGGACDPGLKCLSNLCVNPNSGAGGAGGGGLAPTGSGGRRLQGELHGDRRAVRARSLGLHAGGGGRARGDTSLHGRREGARRHQLRRHRVPRRAHRRQRPRLHRPSGLERPKPWFDSTLLSVDAMASAFNSASNQIFSGPETPVGCEHVLTSATNLLKADATGFVRQDALLVLVLVSDVDDYGAYDQVNGNMCGLGCMTPPSMTPQQVKDELLKLKAGNQTALGAIVVAGDPAVNGGLNFCGQPGTCCGGGDCFVFHADRLWQFAGLLAGNGYTSSLCQGAAAVPTAVQQAFATSIDLACKGYDTPK